MGSESKGHEEPRIKALEKGFRIIEELKEHESIGVSELSSLLDLPTSTTHVYLKTLENMGYVISQNHQYHLSFRFLEIGGRLQSREKVFQAARPEMINLCISTGQTVGLGLYENGKRVELWQIEGEDAVNDNIHIGEYTHLHWTSLGKALLASCSNEEIEHIINQHGFPRATEKTITSKDKLFREVEAIRRQGYAIEDEERKRGIRSVSVPLIDSKQNPIGALGINTPKNEMTIQRCDYIITELKKKSDVISIRYNYKS